MNCKFKQDGQEEEHGRRPEGRSGPASIKRNLENKENSGEIAHVYAPDQAEILREGEGDVYGQSFIVHMSNMKGGLEDDRLSPLASITSITSSLCFSNQGLWLGACLRARGGALSLV